MKPRDTSESRLRTRLLMGAALLALFCFLAAGGVWHHHDSGTETSCPLCQAAHMPAAAPVAPPAPIRLRRAGAGALRSGTILYASPELLRASSRAPPSEI